MYIFIPLIYLLKLTEFGTSGVMEELGIGNSGVMEDEFRFSNFYQLFFKIIN
jgi:hypothetical protein